MNETVTERGPCTECGTPHAACVGPDYCCDECLHLDADWDGYEQPEPARPVSGDTREALREVLRAAFVEALEPSVPRDPPMSRKIAERWAARLLGLPAVRAALDAQETVRRVDIVLNDWAEWANGDRDVPTGRVQMMVRDVRAALRGHR